jgi:hypothetical protein
MEDRMEKGREFREQRNEGEGNRTAAREYNEAQHRFVKSDKVDEHGREAARDLDRDAIRRELEQSEAAGRRHAVDEDPEIRRSYKKD